MQHCCSREDDFETSQVLRLAKLDSHHLKVFLNSYYYARSRVSIIIAYGLVQRTASLCDPPTLMHPMVAAGELLRTGTEVAEVGRNCRVVQRIPYTRLQHRNFLSDWLVESFFEAG